MRLAVTDFLSGNYELAREGFREYLDSYPTSSRAAEAQLYMGDLHFNQREYDQAIIEYDLLLQKYPNSVKKVTALYKKGLALAELDETEDALTYLRQVVSDFPDSTEAASAQQKIDDLTGER
jgi:tol-pal system protein YbgF